MNNVPTWKMKEEELLHTWSHIMVKSAKTVLFVKYVRILSGRMCHSRCMDSATSS